MSNSEGVHTSNSEGVHNSEGVLDYTNKNLDNLPTEDPNWSTAKILLLQGNQLETLDASLLPRTLTYLDLSENPLKEIRGTLPNLTDLLLKGTMIKKIPRLPDTLITIEVSETPFFNKYRAGYLQVIKPYSDEPFDIYETVVDRTPQKRRASYNSNNTTYSNNSNNANSEPNQPVMILERLETEDEINYRVQTLSGATKIIPNYNLSPYDPALAKEVTPIPASTDSARPHIYIDSGHGEDMLFEKPVPPGCVYVTIEECGLLSQDWFKLLYAIEDKPPGIKEKLRDPVKNRVELMAHFGKAFHVHYPEAELEGDRTYVEHINFPLMGWDKTDKCFISKSGIYSIDSAIESTISSEYTNRQQLEKVAKVFDCRGITSDDLDYIFGNSLYPKRKMIDSILYHDSVPYQTLHRWMTHFQYSQSWAFKMFPGVHYNFSCRGITKHSDTNARIGRRRAKSIEGPRRNLDSLSTEEIRGPIGTRMLMNAARAGEIDKIQYLIGRGIDINVRDSYGKSVLENSIEVENIDCITFLLTIPGIDKTGVVDTIRERIEKVRARSDIPIRGKRYIIHTYGKIRQQITGLEPDPIGDLEPVVAPISTYSRLGGKRKGTRHRRRVVRKTRRKNKN